MGTGARPDLEFRYTEAERQALAAAVPDPDWPNEPDDWDRLVTFAHQNAFRADKAGYIARELELMARECLDEEAALRSSKEDADHVRKIARAAQKLKTLLLAPTPDGTDFARVFLGVDVLIDDQRDRATGLNGRTVLLGLLQELIDGEVWVGEMIAAWREENTFASKHHPGFARFVAAAITFWHVWTDRLPGASKEGGPAARFLCAAVNPLLAFAKLRGLQLRRGGFLTVEGAGELIEEIRRLDPPDGE